MNAPTDKPRGVLRRHLQGDLAHARHAPSPALAGLVEHYWQVRWNLEGHPAQTQETLPHPNVHLVVERGRTRIWGVHHGRFARRLEGRGCVFGVKFRADGFHPFLRRPVRVLVGHPPGAYARREAPR